MAAAAARAKLRLDKTSPLVLLKTFSVDFNTRIFSNFRSEIFRCYFIRMVLDDLVPLCIKRAILEMTKCHFFSLKIKRGSVTIALNA